MLPVYVMFNPNLSLHQAPKMFLLTSKKNVFVAMYGKTPSANIGFLVLENIVFTRMC